MIHGNSKGLEQHSDQCLNYSYKTSMDPKFGLMTKNFNKILYGLKIMSKAVGIVNKFWIISKININFYHL